MKHKLLSLFVAFIATTALWASNTITYTASSQLSGYSGSLNVGATTFGSAITSHTFGNGTGTITCSGEITMIGDYAFGYCSALTSITIPNSVTTIGIFAFLSCRNLTSITIPNSVTTINGSAFSDCSGLISITWNAKNCEFSTSSPFNNISSQITYFTFGNEVETIPSYLCSNMSQLTSITIPNSVTTIEEYAFHDCSGLTFVTIPESVTSIGAYVFANCQNLTTVFWNAKDCTHSIDKYGTMYGSPFDSNYSDEKSILLNNIIFGSNVERIPAYLCERQTNLQSISLPNSVKYIDQSAFRSCSGLTSIVIPNSVKTIRNEAFAECSNLENLLIGNSIDSIGRNAFCSCKLTSITLPQSTRAIGASAFSGIQNLKYFEVKNPQAQCEELILAACPMIETIIGPASLFTFSADCMMYLSSQPYTATSITVTGGELDETGCLSITQNYKRLKYLNAYAATNTTLTDEAFMGCYNLETLLLPSQLEYIPYMAVAGCKNLKSIDIPASVVEIDQSAFEDCRSIQTITFGGVTPASAPGRTATAATSQLKKIGNWAFYNAHELQHLDIPEGVEEIGDGAFYGCTYLEDLVLPSSVKTIGDNCFSLCSKMKKITVTSLTPPTIYAKTFYDVNRAIPVYVPDEAVDTYKSDTYWKEFNIQGGATNLLDRFTDPFLPLTEGGGGCSRFTKIVKDGRLLINRNGKIYNALGF